MLENFPRVKLMSLPTPLEHASQLSKVLGVNVYFKRDDVMELALGGNKARKLEFLIGDVIKKKCDLVITTGSIYSNHVRLTSAAAKKFGLDVLLIIRGKRPKKLKGNLLLNSLFGAQMEFCDVEEEEVEGIMEERAKELRDAGKSPYVIPPGGACPIGVLGYVNAAFEIVSQALSRGIKVDYIVHSTGSGATQAGLVIGLKLAGCNAKVLGVSCGDPKEYVEEKALRLVKDTARLLNANIDVTRNDVIVFDEYVCGGYGVVTREVVEAIKYACRTEGLLLDPVYTAKAFIGLMNLAKEGRIPRGSNVVFVHTGGIPLVFHFDDVLQ